MKYNVYNKEKDTEDIYVCVKTEENNSSEYTWRNVENLNDGCYEDYTKVPSFNIFEAKQIIDNEKIKDKRYYPSHTFEYWIKQVKD